MADTANMANVARWFAGEMAIWSDGQMVKWLYGYNYTNGLIIDGLNLVDDCKARYLEQ